MRILANHLNGSPRYNIELRGNKSLTIIGNICEGARREAIIYTMPSWLESDSPQVQIVGNNITNGGKDDTGRYPAIGIYSRDATHRTSGFNITGNYFACTDDDADWVIRRRRRRMSTPWRSPETSGTTAVSPWRPST